MTSHRARPKPIVFDLEAVAAALTIDGTIEPYHRVVAADGLAAMRDSARRLRGDRPPVIDQNRGPSWAAQM